MKQCPACKQIFNDQYDFCLTDGEPLGDSSGITLIRPDGFSVPTGSGSDWNQPTIVARFEPAAIAPVEGLRKSPEVRLLAFLALGLLIGGGLAFAGFIAAGNVTLAPLQSASSTPVPASATLLASGAGGDADPAKISADTKPAVNKQKTPRKSSDLGRVVVLNAIVRLTPGMDGLPLGEISFGTTFRVGRRAAPRSPWYLITLPNGISGWLHGNTFKFAQ